VVQRYARFISRYRYLIMLVWVALTVAAMFGLPSLTTVVAHQSTNFLPESAPVMQAGKLLNHVHPGTAAGSSAVIAIHDKNGLTTAEKDYFHQVLAKIDANKDTNGVEKVQDAANIAKSAASAFDSKDGTTEIALVDFPGQDISSQTAKALSNLHQAFAHPPSGSNVYFTGDAPIQQDDTTISQNGVSKTAGVTVVLVLVILLLVFRSVMAPLVTLIAIGLSFLLSSSVVAWLAVRGLPVSSFTQTFMVAVLFGAGTDYSIIILNRYREELMRGEDRVTTLANTIASVGKTIIFSSLTVIVSFAVLYFANFGLYRSAVGVSVGVFASLLCCLTFVPALMDSLQGKLYWPRKIKVGGSHSQSKVWQATGGLSIRRPWWTLLALAVVLLPIALLFTNQRSFDPMDDIPTAPSVQGFHVVSRAFGPGNVLPMNIVLHTSQNLRTPQGLATIENVTHAIASLPSVDEVQSVTQPTGTAITSFQLANQNGKAASGLKQIQQGLGTLSNHLASASQSVSSASTSSSPLVSGANQVASGNAQLATGLKQAATGSSKLAAGATQLASGTKALQQGLTQYSASVQSVGKGATSLASGVSQTATGAKNLAGGTSKLAQGSQQVAQVASQLANAIASWSASHPNDTSNPTWQQIQQLAATAKGASQQTSQAATQVNQGAQGLSQGATGLVQGAKQIQGATGQLAQGATKLSAGAGSLATGATGLAGGVSGLNTGFGKFASGATSLATGSQELATGVTKLQSAFGPLATGLQQAASAGQKLQQGVQTVGQALSQSQQASTAGNPGFYLPASALTNVDLLSAMNAYISPDGHVANITVVLKQNPYSLNAMNQVPSIQRAAQVAFNSSPIHTGSVLAAGTTPVQAALNQVSTSDFYRTIISIVVAIFILLALMLRSFITPLYILGSLAVTYGVTMGILQTIAVHVLHKSGLSWPVPFFVFLLLVALGVDYSIFLFSRFDEELRKGLSHKEAMYKSMGQMGNVIFSAALIMGGTFGSMMVAGVTSLLEIGMGVVVGLFLYAFVLLAFFVPAWTSVIGSGHHWPFIRANAEDRLR